MTKHLLSVCVLSFFALLATAQTVQPEEGQTWWGYYETTNALSSIGTEEAERYDCAIFIPGDHDLMRGCTVHAVRFYIRDKRDVSNVKVWANPTLPGNVDNAVSHADVPVSALKDEGEGMIEVKLPTPVEIGEEGLFVGYSFNVDFVITERDKRPIVTTSGAGEVNLALIFRTSKTFPNWGAPYGYGYGNLAMQVLVSGSIKQAAVSVSDFGDYIVESGKTVNISLPVKNLGVGGIHSIDYVMETDGVAAPEQHYDLPVPFTLYNTATTISLPVPADAQNAYARKKITINKINGEENAMVGDERSGNGSLTTISQAQPRRTVMEEFTGTWCGWCPRGMAGIEQLEKDYGWQFIPIALHVMANNSPASEPMASADFTDFINAMSSGYPSCQINRSLYTDPYYGTDKETGIYTVYKDIDKQLRRTTEAKIDIAPTWADDAKTKIEVNADAVFGFSRDNAPYSIAYVLTEDGVTGEAGQRAWMQYNEFAGQAAVYDDPELYEFTHGDRYMALTYNHVAIGAWGLTTGVPGSIPSPLVADAPVQHTYTLDISAYNQIQHKDQLNVVALLLNTETGIIVNAATARVGEKSSDGIQTLSTAAATLRADAPMYNLGGQRVGKDYKGIVIQNGKKIVKK